MRLQEAQERQYVTVRGRNTTKLEHDYFEWCKEAGIPYVKVCERWKYADVSLDTITTRYFLSDEGQKRVVEIAGAFGIKPGKVGYGRLYCYIEQVPNEQAGVLALELLRLYESEKMPEGNGLTI